MRLPIILSVIAIGLMAFPAQATPIYSHVIVSSGAVDPSHGVGAPDGQTVSFTSDAAWIEFGFPQEATGEVVFKVYMSNTSGSADYWMMNGATTVQSGTMNFGTNQGHMEIDTRDADLPFDRVRLFPNAPLFEVDAAWITVNESTLDVPDDSELIDSTVPSDEIASPPAEDEEATSVTSSYPRLVKLPSDEDLSTQYDTAVYAIDPNTGKRRPFFNETIYRSWFGSDFDRVEIVSATEMASYSLGAPMFMHPGTYLVKVQSMADVYAVERGGVLRRISNEAAAEALYGPRWNQTVRDISPTEWPRYTVGSDLASIFPDDTIVMDGHLITWHIHNGVRRQIPFNDLEYHGAQVIFALPYGTWFGLEEADDRLSIYPIGILYDREDDIGWFAFE